MPDLSIVIPCYLKNEELLALTKSTIFSLKEAALPEYELILVDDGSPMYGGYLRQEADTYILHTKNKGFIKSVNDGLRLARGKYVLLSNNDIRAAPNFYTVSSDIFEKNPDVFSVHPRMLFYEDPMLLGNNTYVEGKERWCQSSFFVMRNMDNQHMFPEHFQGTGGAYEDWFFWSMIRDQGWLTAYTTETCFQHKDSSTTQVVGEQSKYHEENRRHFIDFFGKGPEEYYNELYPEQMQMPWREEFLKL